MRQDVRAELDPECSRAAIGSFLIVVAILSIGGCIPRPLPTPTPDAVATQVAVMRAAEATLAASVPTPTFTALPTATATETPTPYPTATPTPTVTWTPRPSPTPMPTPAPVVVPGDWKLYSHFSGKFHVFYPPHWKVDSEGPSDVSFKTAAFSGVGIGLYRSDCMMKGLDDERILSCLAVEAAQSFSSLDKFQLVEKGTHPGTRGVYYLVYTVKDYVYEVWTTFVRLSIFVDEGRALEGIYFHAGDISKSAADAETAEFVKVIFMVSLSERPPPRVTPTPRK